MHTLDVFVQVGDRECFSTIRALCALVVVHLPNVPAQVAHSKFFLTVRAGLLDPFMGLPHVSREVVHADVLLTVGAVGLFSQVDALHVVVQKLLGLELLLAIGAFVIPDLFMEVFHMVVQVLVLLVADVARRSLTQVNLFDVVLQCILGDKLLLTETALSDLVVTVLFEDVPAQVSNREGLVAQLAFNLFSMVGQDVFIQVGNLTAGKKF